VGLGKGAQEGGVKWVKRRKVSISRTLYGYKSLFYNKLAPGTGVGLGKPLALSFWEAASVEMLTEFVDYLPGGADLLLSDLSLSLTRKCKEDSRAGHVRQETESLARGQRKSERSRE
jgi:hypothetical protein